MLGGRRVVGAEQRVAPLEDEVTVGAGHAEEVGEDAQRHLRRHRGHEVDLLPVRGGTGDQVVDDGAGVVVDRRAQPLDRPRGEDGLEDPPQPGVLRVVHVQHHLAEHREALVGERRQERAARLGREPVLVAVDLVDEGVGGDRPEPGAVDELEQRVVAEQAGDGRLRVPRDAALLAQRVERRVRDARTERSTAGEVDRGHLGDESRAGGRGGRRRGPDSGRVRRRHHGRQRSKSSRDIWCDGRRGGADGRRARREGRRGHGRRIGPRRRAGAAVRTRGHGHRRARPRRGVGAAGRGRARRRARCAGDRGARRRRRRRLRRRGRPSRRRGTRWVRRAVRERRRAAVRRRSTA